MVLMDPFARSASDHAKNCRLGLLVSYCHSETACRARDKAHKRASSRLQALISLRCLAGHSHLLGHQRHADRDAIGQAIQPSK